MRLAKCRKNKQQHTRVSCTPLAYPSLWTTPQEVQMLAWTAGLLTVLTILNFFQCLQAEWLSPAPLSAPSPALHLLAQVVEALAQLVHLSLLALQVGAVLLEAAGQ